MPAVDVEAGLGPVPPVDSLSGLKAWYTSLDVLLAVYWILAGLAGICIILFLVRWAYRKSHNAPLSPTNGYETTRPNPVHYTSPEDGLNPLRDLEDLQQRHFADGNVSKPNLPGIAAIQEAVNSPPSHVRIVRSRAAMIVQREEGGKSGTNAPGFALATTVIFALLCVVVILLLLVNVWAMLRALAQTVMTRLKGKKAPKSAGEPENELEQQAQKVGLTESQVSDEIAPRNPDENTDGIISSPTSQYSFRAVRLSTPEPSYYYLRPVSPYTGLGSNRG